MTHLMTCKLCILVRVPTHSTSTTLHPHYPLPPLPTPHTSPHLPFIFPSSHTYPSLSPPPPHLAFTFPSSPSSPHLPPHLPSPPPHPSHTPTLHLPLQLGEVSHDLIKLDVGGGQQIVGIRKRTHFCSHASNLHRDKK